MKTTLKKYMFTLCTAVLLSVLLCFSASALDVGDTFTEGFYSYEVTAFGEVKLVDVDSSISGTQEVPSYANGQRVTAIGEYAFGFCRDLKVLTLPDTIIDIEPYAFTYCEGLEEITIGGNLKSSDKGAFSGCEKLRKVNITNLMFWMQIDFGKSETELPYDPTSNPLYNGAELYVAGETDKNLVIPSGTSVIKKAAFSGCSSHSSVILPDSVVEIENGAFSDSESLVSIVWPRSITKIGQGVFDNCPKFNRVNIKDLNAWIKTDFSTYPLGSLYLNGVLTENLFIPSAARTVKKYAFYSADSIRNIIIPEGVQEIEENAFADIATLEAVILPKSIKKISENAFASSGKDGFLVYYNGDEADWENIENAENSGITAPDAYEYSLDHIHDYKETVTQPTYTADGKKEFTCSYCDDAYTEKLDRLTLGKVSGLKVKSTGTTKITLSWSAVTGAQSYTVYYSKNGKSWKTKTTSKTSLTVEKLSSGTSYRFKVKASAGSFYGAESSTVKTATKVKKVTLSSVKSAKAKQLTASWKTANGASGYVLEYSTSKKFTSKTTKKVAFKKGTTKKTTVKKLKSKKKYYVRIRAYKTVNGKKVYGSYSSVKSIKIK